MPKLFLVTKTEFLTQMQIFLEMQSHISSHSLRALLKRAVNSCAVSFVLLIWHLKKWLPIWQYWWSFTKYFCFHIVRVCFLLFCLLLLFSFNDNSRGGTEMKVMSSSCYTRVQVGWEILILINNSYLTQHITHKKCLDALQPYSHAL